MTNRTVESPPSVTTNFVRRDAAVQTADRRGEHLLIGYNGSPDAEHALRRAAELFPGAQATIVYVWQSVLDVSRRYASPGGFLGAETSDELRADEAHAECVAEAGCQIALRAGLNARALAREGFPVYDTLESLADEVRPTVIVVGSRGLTGLRSMLGSVSRPVVGHAHLPVLVIPVGNSPRVARPPALPAARSCLQSQRHADVTSPGSASEGRQ